jgi:hypothetical protein
MNELMPTMQEALEAERIDPAALLGLATAQAVSSTPADAPAEEPSTADRKPELGWMSLADRLIVREIVKTSLGQEGAADSDTLLELVEEFVQLNTERIQSFHHDGYARAILGRPLPPSLQHLNEERRLWFLAGALAGVLRHDDVRVVEPFLKQHDALVAKLSVSELPCATELLPAIASSLLDLKRYRLLRDWTLAHSRRLPSMTFLRFTDSLMRTGERLMRERLLSEAKAVFETLGDLFETFTGSHPEWTPWRMRVTHRRAQLHQLVREFEPARRFFQEVVKDGSGPDAARALCDLGLGEASCTRLEDTLPRPLESANIGLIASLERGRPHFEAAVARDSAASIKGHFCLGLLSTLAQTPDPQTAAEHFGKAFTSMLGLDDPPAAPEMLDWCAFLLGISLLETGRESTIGEVSNCFDRVIVSKRSFPDHLWRRAVKAAAELNDPSIAERLCRHLLDADNAQVHGIIAASDLHLRSPAIRATYVRWLASGAAHSKERWEEGLKVLPVAINARDLAVAAESLDVLEHVAHEDDQRRHLLLQRLADLDFHSPAWSREDATACRVRLMDCDGDREGARLLLSKQFFQWRSLGNPLALRRALFLLDEMAELGEPEQSLQPLRESVRPRTVAPSAVVTRDVGILYIGGNETQKQYEQAIAQSLKRRFRSLRLMFLFPGWTSNWNDWLDKFKTNLPAAHAVVLNSLVRTQLGRHVRKLCNEHRPWFPCGGRGRQSIERSIEQAALFVLERDKP